MDGPKRFWELDVPLSQLTLYRDWDYSAATISSLQTYLFEHGTIPLWNVQFCGGRPELALPHGMAFVWYSAVAYLLPPYPAIFVLWAGMTVVGAASFAALLDLWLNDKGAAGVGAALYCLNGFFASRFSEGHLTFAFLHLIPLLLLLFERWRLRERSTASLVWITVASFAFFTAGLPHALIYFYPLVGLYLAVWLTVGLRDGRPHRLRTELGLPWIAHGFGALIALYKLWPVFVWQSEHPREGVVLESMTPLDVLANSLAFVSNYRDPGFKRFANQDWYLWEYNWFVGPVPWLLAGLLFLRVSRRRVALSRNERFAYLLASLSLGAGVWLALGNDNPFSPSRLFQFLPFASGIRVFGRFQILCLAGLSIFCALGFKHAVSSLPAPLRTPGAAVLSVLVLGLPIAQAVALVLSIPATTDAQLEERYAWAPETRVPRLIDGQASENFLLRRGYWIRDCYEPLNIRRLAPRDEPILPVSSPPPESVGLRSDGVVLRFGELPRGRVVVNLPTYDGFSASREIAAVRAGRLLFPARELSGRDVVITADTSTERAGFLASGLALASYLLWLGLIARRALGGRSRSPVPP